MTRQEILNYVDSMKSWVGSKNIKELKKGFFKIYGIKRNKTLKLRLVK